MDTNTVVSQQIEEGRGLLLRLADAGVAVTVAAWVQRAEDGQWLFVIALPLIDRQGFAAGVDAVMPVFRSREQVWIVSDDLSLIGANHPRAVELLRIRERIAGHFAGRFKPSSLAGLAIREVYVYPERLRMELTDAQKQLLADLYARSPLAVDLLPYTEEMERIHLDFVQQTSVAVSVGEIFRALLNLRKQSRLVTKSQPLVPAEANAATPAETA
jgi:hypothetical protein